MKLLAHRRDPITRDRWSFPSKKMAGLYFELALTHFVTFKGLYLMAMAQLHGPEALSDGFDLKKEVRSLTEMGKQDADLLTHFNLPLEELFQIWQRGRQALRRLADFSNYSPTRRDKIEALIAEQEEVMLAILEKHEARAN